MQISRFLRALGMYTTVIIINRFPHLFLFSWWWKLVPLTSQINWCVCVCVCVCVRACVFCRHVLSVLANKHWTGKQITVSKTRPVLLNALYVYYNVKIKVTDEFECFQCYKLGRNVFRPPTKKYKFCYVVSVLFFLTKSVQLTQSGQVVSGWLSPQLPNVLELNLVSLVSTKTRLANWILVHISINLILFLVMLWNRKEPFFVRKILGF